MGTKKVIALMAAAWITMVCSAGDSAPFRLDTRTEPVEESSIDVTWNASWVGGDAGATVVIADNGTEVKRATGTGGFIYTPSAIGKHELTYATYIDGIAQDEIYSAVVFTTVLGCNHFTTNSNARAATCTAAGYTGDLVCEICGVVVEHGATISALGHDAIETKAAKAAACTESGWTHEVRCIRCNEILEASLSIAALGHNIDEGVVTKPPTISEDGVKTYCCTRCGVAVKTEAIPRLVIEWTIAANGVLTGVSLNGATEVTIPDNVKSIGDRAFYMCAGLTSVTIPNSVTNIGEEAFWGCSNLLNIEIPNSVKGIGAGAFANCANLESMTLPFIGSRRGDNTGASAVFSYIFGSENFQGATNTVSTYLTGNGTKTATLNRYLPVSLTSVAITDESLVSRGAFDQCRCLTNVVINDGVNYIGQYAFCRNSLHEMNIPIGVAKIDEYAFYYCGEMTSVVVPNSVTNICIGAFSGCSSLTNMVLPFVGSARGKTETEDSLLGYIFGKKSYIGGAETEQYYKASTSVVYYISASLESVAVMDETRIGYGAFWNCNGLQHVGMSESVKSIDEKAFYACSAVTSITVPNGVTNIGIGAFSGCSSLTNMVLPFVGSKRGNTETVDAVFGYIFGDRPYDGGTETEQYYKTSKSVVYYIPESLKSISIMDEPMIGRMAFWNCGGLKHVKISQVTTTMGSQAFKNCFGLQSVDIESIASWCGVNFASAASNPLCYCRKLQVNGDAVIDIEIPDGITSIGKYAFRNDNGGNYYESIVFPSSLTSIGAAAFEGGKCLKRILFMGNAPSLGTSCFANCNADCVVLVKRNSTGWGVEIPGTWNGMRVEFLDQIPEIDVSANASVVTNAIEAAGFADAAAIKAAIGGEGAATKYVAFKEWAGSVKGAAGSAGAASAAGEAAVVANTNAAAAWLLGAERLFVNAPEIEFGECNVASDTGEVTVSITVKDGEDAVAVASEKVAAMFEATGDLGDWNGAAKLTPEVTVEEGDGATMRFKVTPGDGTAPRAFLRIRK